MGLFVCLFDHGTLLIGIQGGFDGGFLHQSFVFAQCLLLQLRTLLLKADRPSLRRCYPIRLG